MMNKFVWPKSIPGEKDFKQAMSRWEKISGKWSCAVNFYSLEGVGKG
jgi:hypothetical protein